MEHETTTTRRTVQSEPIRTERVTEGHRRDVDVQEAAAAAIARDPISWGPIWAGVLAAFGLFFLFSLIALAAGLSLVEFNGGAGAVDDVPVDLVAMVVSGLFLVVAFFAGGFIAAWSSGLVEEGRAILNGFLVWALAIVLLLLFAALGVGQIFGAAGEIFGSQFAAGATPDVDVDPEALLTAFQEAAWSTVFAIVLAMAAAVLGALVATRDEVRGRDWTMSYRRR
ncbi:MAG TPA: hypothetical protein VMP67_04110 [Candidatus Limnocylindria bacterium]|nr:hypothetical protein [Candidatus Limnocylindria bacterium]